MPAIRLPVFSLCCVKNDIFLLAKLTAREQYVSLLHQAKYQCFNIKIFCPVTLYIYNIYKGCFTQKKNETHIRNLASQKLIKLA